MSEEEFYSNLPKKRIAAGALFRDEQGRILIMKPTYKESWIMPGGMVEEGESPREGCIREVKEEIGLVRNELHLLCVEYDAHSDTGTKNESIKFFFDGGVLSAHDIERIVLQKEEVKSYDFVEPTRAFELLNPHLAARLKNGLEALRTGKVIYFEDSNPYTS